MKNFLLIGTLIFSQCVAANNFTDYQNHIAHDRLILIFDKQVNGERETEIIQSSGLVSGFNFLPSPALAICFVNNFEEAQQYFASVPEIKFVSFFITDGNAHYAGVLNDFFVKLKDKNFEPLLREKLKHENLTEPTRDKYIPNLYQIRIPQSAVRNTIEWCSEFLNEGWVDYAVPDYLFNPLVTSNDQYYTRQWNIHNTGSGIQGNGTPGADMKVDSAWTLTTGDPNIKVAIIDSGVDTLQADLVQNILQGHDAISDSTDGYPTPAFPEDGHGTCCAGIVAAVQNNSIGISGVAPSCKIIPVRTFYYMNLQGNILPYSTAAAFADAIGWSWDTAHADILSNSWGLPPSLIGFLPGGTQPVDDAIQLAYVNGRNGKGIAMFFSSGNDNDSIGPIWPGKLAQTIAVNATSMCDERKSPTDCSGENWGGDFGTNLDFSAPGVRIATTDMTGNHGFSTSSYYLLFNGTSAACPNAAAVGALLLSLRPDLHAEDVRNIIAYTCDRVGGYAYDSVFINGTWSRELGYGRINAYQALQYSLYYSAVPEVANQIELKVFPNPTHNILNIQYKGGQNGWFKLYDITGRQLLQQQLHEGLNSTDTSELPSGIYLLKADTERGIVTEKVTIFR